VAPGEQADEHAIDHVVLSYDDLSNFCPDARELGSSELKSGIWLHRTILSQAA
jgi:hypothetical protein